MYALLCNVYMIQCDHANIVLKVIRSRAHHQMSHFRGSASGNFYTNHTCHCSSLGIFLCNQSGSKCLCTKASEKKSRNYSILMMSKKTMWSTSCTTKWLHCLWPELQLSCPCSKYVFSVSFIPMFNTTPQNKYILNTFMYHVTSSVQQPYFHCLSENHRYLFFSYIFLYVSYSGN